VTDRLKQLIEQADLAPPDAAEPPRDLAARVRGLHGQRRRRKLVAAVAVAAIAAGTLLWIGLPPARGPNAVVRDDGPAIAAQRALGEARQQIERAENIVARLLVAECRRQLAALPKTADLGLDRQSRYEDQIGPAAAALLLTGDERAKRPGHSAAAREDYACVIETFPNTIWATRAAERLAALKQ
jgi:hypothetical protein